MSESKITLPDFTSVLKSSSLAACLEILREPLLRLSEIDIPKPLFNQWKKEGLINFQITTSEEKLWNRFSILDYVILNIIKVLWENEVDTNIIKNILHIILDGKGIRNHVDDILDASVLTDQTKYEDNPDLDLMHYIVAQKKLNPQLPFFTNIEAYIIGSFKLNRPFSIILFENGKIEMFTTDSFADAIAPYLIKEMFSKTFLNVSIKSIVNKVLLANSNENVNTVNMTVNNFIEKLFAKGYSIDTISELFGTRTESVDFTEETIQNPRTVNIEKLIREKTSQDILIKIRDGEKKSIRRLLITKK
jgi:hypothetical protein